MQIDAVAAATAWQPRVADGVRSTPEPSRDELRLIREVLDPKGLYTR